MASKVSVKDIFMLVIAMIIWGSIAGIGLYYAGNIENQTINGTAISTVVDPTLLRLASFLVPTVGVIATIMLFVKQIS